MSSNGKGLSSPKGKKIMGYAYGFGASIVIIGALFKILHLPGAPLMLSLGMGTEALLFALGAFEPAHHEGSKWDWSTIYPEIGREKSPDELLSEEKDAKKKNKGNKLETSPKEEIIKTSDKEEKTHRKSPTHSTGVSTQGLSDEDMGKWNESISKISATADHLSKLAVVGDVSESYISKLTTAGETIEDLSNAQEESAKLIKSSSSIMANNYKTTSEKLDLALSSATDILKDGLSTVTDKLGNNLEATSEIVKDELSKASSIAAETLKNSTSGLAQAFSTSASGFESTFADAYNNSASVMTNANDALAEGYKKVTDALSNKLKMIEGSTSETGKELQQVSKNLAAINSVYELQLKTINEELSIKEAQTATQGSVNEQLTIIQKALSEAAIANTTYKAESNKLTQSITDLNSVYGNMLSSLNA